MKRKRFIAISSEIVDGKLIYLNSSAGDALTNLEGIHTKEAIEFLYGLHLKYKKDDTVFICYAFKSENEFIFRHLPLELKDELLQSRNVRRQVDEQRTLKEDLENVYYDKHVEMTETEAVEYYNRIQEINLVLNDVGKIKFNDYRITLANGKQLTISKNKRSMIIYDVFGYFRKPLSKTVERFLNERNVLLTEEKSDDLELRKLQNFTDCFYISKLMSVMYEKLQTYGIKVRRFHGSSTVTSAIFSTHKVRKEYKNFKTPKSLSTEAKKAVQSAFYGARTEQLKLGRFKNINVYDMNSAYAKACMFLPPMSRHPTFTKTWNNQPFSWWFIEYDLPKNVYYGLLPNRDTSQLIRYKRRGKGYYYQPEILYLMMNFPDCFEIKHGFYVPYKRSAIADAVTDLYEIRKTLKANNDPLEKVIKLALATIYGKFCQRVGYAYFYNLFYAGYVTSFVRAQLMNATRGKESKTICFLTDAIHTTADLKVVVSDEMGDFRHNKYEYGTYLGAGIYELFNGETETKKATRGFTELDFQAAYKQLVETGTYNAFQDYFVGHNLNRIAPYEFQNYLGMSRKKIKIAPLESKVRLFNKLQIDLENENVDSDILDNYSGRESLIYRPNPDDNSDIIFDKVEAGKK